MPLSSQGASCAFGKPSCCPYTPKCITRSNAFALVVGDADDQRVRSLPTVRDATDIAALLTDPEHCAYPPPR